MSLVNDHYTKMFKELTHSNSVAIAELLLVICHGKKDGGCRFYQYALVSEIV